MSAARNYRPHGLRVIATALVCFFGAMIPCAAQTSASYSLTETTFNSGGSPQQGTILTSSSYRISLASVGDTAIASTLSSSSFHIDAGFVSTNPPPGEVAGLDVTTAAEIDWDPERSAGTYNLYRDLLGSLPGDYGGCYQAGLQVTSWTEPSNPAPGTGWFYLVTAKNRLREEGTKGYNSAGIERSNDAACP